MQGPFGNWPPGQPPPQPPLPTAGMRICPGCGVVAPLSRTSCNVCNAPFGAQPLLASGRTGGAVLVCIHAADFACRACGMRSPLATIDALGQAECMGCGLRQAFDAVQWTDALTFAHGVGDLSGPNLDPVAARSRHAKIGSEFTSSTKTQNTLIMDASGTRNHSLKTAVSPGHPVCKTCHVPLDVWLEGPTTKTRCRQCNEVATYGLPDGAKNAYAQLCGVIANEQRTDRPIARLGRTQAGVESIVCPQCGAGLSAGGGTELAKCAYCGLAVRIPGTLARQQQRGALPKMDPFWVLLAGPSVGRTRLAAGKSEDPDDDDDDDDDLDEAPPPMQQQWGAAAPYAMPMQHGIPVQPSSSSSSSSGSAIAIVVGVVALLVLAGAGVGVFVWMNMEEEPPAKAVPAAPAAPAQRPAKRR